MTRRRAWKWAGFVVAAALALTACTTIPSAGPVNEGAGVVASTDPFVPIAEGPRADDGPTAIVSGFVKASSAGFASDFSVAKQYLTSPADTTWDPTARVIVFDSGALTPKFNRADSTVSYDIPVLATIDESGRMTEAADGTRETLTFEMARDAEGQWRISGLDDGTILAGATFDRQFTQVSLVFASVDESTQVPEMRWLPQSKVATLAARELVEGPSPWLAPAVHTGFPAASGLDVGSVVVTDGVAAVQLTADSAGTAAERSLAEEQLNLTLESLPGIQDVNVTVGGVPLGGDGSASLNPAPLPSANAAAFIGGKLGVWDGADLWTVPNEVGGLPAQSSGLAQSFGTPIAAWIVGGNTLVTSNALDSGVVTLNPADADEEPPTSPMDVDAIYQGNHLVAPTMDRHGWIWTTESAGTASVLALKTNGAKAEVAVDWLRGTTVQAVTVSRDGARIAVLSQAGGKQVLEVASIVRGADGSPLTIGEPLTVGVDLGPAIDLTWVDALTLAVLGAPAGDARSDLWLVDVGGLTTALKAVSGAVDVTAREGERSLVVVNAQGEVYARSGTDWSQVTTGPSRLAYAG